MSISDGKSAVAGAVFWAAAVPVVKFVGPLTAGKPTPLTLAAVGAFQVGLAYATTPVLSLLLGWKTRDDKVRGIAIGLGVAQALDGLCHLLAPRFYHEDADKAISCAGNIFLGAGLLGIFSAFA
jgi:drug/metabolite transporter (DMT)-like permease